MKKETIHDMSSLVEGLLARHGIKKQVTAAMLIEEVKAIWATIGPEHTRGDVRPLSFVDNDLRIACRHSAAAHEVSRFTGAIIDELKSKFPDLTVNRIICRIAPHEVDREL